MFVHDVNFFLAKHDWLKCCVGSLGLVVGLPCRSRQTRLVCTRPLVMLAGHRVDQKVESQR